MKKENFLLILLSIAIAVVDQYTKSIIDNRFNLGEIYPVIDGLFNLTNVRNSGAAFGFGGAFNDWIRIFLFKVIPVIAIGWLTVLLFKKEDTKLVKLSYALIVGGAVGNIIDRIRLDYVVDMFDFYYGKSHFATFNIADAAISLAAGLLILDFLMGYFKKNQKDN